MLTLELVRDELASLTAHVEALGWTLDGFKTAGDDWELDAVQRGILADIRAYEFMLNPGGRRAR
jgi:hypothetical protein